MIDLLTRNLRYAIRSLLRTPGFTAIAVLTLALGIGANSAVFSAVDTVLLRPLPFPDPDRLVRLRQMSSRFGETNVAGPRLLDWARLSPASFEAISGYVVEDVSDTTRRPTERVRRATVLPDFLRVWGVSPAIGRGFTETEHRVGGPAAVLISDRYWQRRLNADPGVLQATVRFGNRSYPVVGVMPPSFAFYDGDVDWWMAERIDAPWMQSRTSRTTIGVGRLRAGVTPEQVRSDMARAQAALARQFPDADRDLSPVISRMKDDLVGGARRSIWLLYGAVSVLLLIVCSNIAALLLSRGSQRVPELAVRYALGATRRAVAAQLLTEAGVLAVIGGAAGLLIAAGITSALQRLAPNVPRLSDAGFDGMLATYTLGTVGVVTLLCGIIPAWRATRGSTPRLDTGMRVMPRHTLQWALAGVQVVLSVALLSGAGLLLQSAAALSRVDAGFDPAPVLAFRISGSFGEELDYNRTVQRINRTIDELEALPGVAAAATAGLLPGVRATEQGEFTLIEGVDGIVADVRVVSPSYFATMQIPVLEGELCRRPADSTGVTEALVNRSFASRYLAGRSPIGLHLASATPDRIVGVVGDAREVALNAEPSPVIYLCFSAPTPFPHFLVRTTDDPAAAAAVVRHRVGQLEPLRSVYDVMPLDERIADAYAENRLRTVLLTSVAGGALLLACVGLYGTLSYVVGLRRREVGLRLALGAGRAGILRQFVWQGMRVAGVAAALGLALYAAASRALSGMLFGVEPTDPATLVAVLVVVLTVAMLASLIPAARAAFLQPMQVLRDE
jgi:putative ABC transport system permease protein